MVSTRTPVETTTTTSTAAATAAQHHNPLWKDLLTHPPSDRSNDNESENDGNEKEANPRRVTMDSNAAFPKSVANNDFKDSSTTDEESDDCDLDPEQRKRVFLQLSQEEVNFDQMIQNMDFVSSPLGQEEQSNDEFGLENIDEDELVRQVERLEKERSARSPPTQQQTESEQQPEPKRQKQAKINDALLKQTKINDAFKMVPAGTITPAKPKPLESNEQMYIGNTLYKRGETWTSKAKDLDGYSFTLASLKRNREENEHNGRKEAVCRAGNVHILLSKTFIGQEESERLLPQKWAQCVNTLNVLEKGRIPLKVLTDQMQGPPPKPDLKYEVGTKKSETLGYTCAYRYNQNDSLPPLSRTKPIVIDLFAGAGGTSLGFKQEGFDVRYKVEIDPAAIGTLHMNFHESRDGIFHEHVNVFLQNCQSKRNSLYPQPGGVDHIHASPPCQGYSRANRFGGANDEANNRVTHDFVASIRYFRPRTASMENVLGMLDSKKGKRKHLLQIMTDLLLLGYQVRLAIVMASHYGDPQDRERIILFAAQRGYKLPDFPKPTHGDGRDVRQKVTVKDVLGDLENIEPVIESGLVQLPNGKWTWDHNAEGTDLKTKENDMDRLVGDLPAKTVRKGNAIKHYSLHRCLTMRERARLQSFPDDFLFCGSLVDKRGQIGNAVPVNLARAIARTVMDSYNNHK